MRELKASYEPQGISVIGIEYVEEARRLAKERKGIDLVEGSILDFHYTMG